MHLKNDSADLNNECLNDLEAVEKASILLCNLPTVLLICFGQIWLSIRLLVYTSSKIQPKTLNHRQITDKGQITQRSYNI